ncbi:MAG: electron transport complex subunit RsxC [Clostridia bacterium]|nr:electron transport complex subunit RsxC [Clostridia bacterium]
MAFSLRGLHVPHRKNTAHMGAVRMPAPAAVTIPVSQHIGAPAKPVVKVGDKVFVGTLIAEQNGYISVPVHSSVSGTVKKIEDITLSSGGAAPAIVIESDGLMTPDENIVPPTVNSREELIEAIKACGLVGLGGAGFPTYVKFSVDPEKIDELIINGAECEPYITSDTRTMIDRVDDIRFGLENLMRHLGIKKVIICIEDNKREAIASMQKMAADMDGVTVKVLGSKYPQGGEKVMIYHATGKVVPGGKLPIDVGSIVCNCTTLAEIGRYLKTGIPLVEKCITVDGACVKEPKNVIAPIGASMEDVFAFCGGFVRDPYKVLYGGPMMGIAVPDLTAPILKNTNAIIALDRKEGRLPKVTPCLRCGACTNTCPFGLNPAAIADALRLGDVELLKKLRVDLCMECGCCAFYCPANRPLVQNNKLGKTLLREAAAKEKALKEATLK